MARRREHEPEQGLGLLRRIEEAYGSGKTMLQACEEAEITTQMYYRLRREYGSLQVDHTQRLKQLEQENARLKRQVLSLEKLTLKDASTGEF